MNGDVAKSRIRVCLAREGGTIRTQISADPTGLTLQTPGK